MKIKTTYLYTAGAVVGLILGFLLPKEAGIPGLLETLSQMGVTLVRYMLLPTLFFSLAVGVTQLRRESRLRNTMIRGFVYLLLASLIFIILGMIITLIVGPERVRSTTQVSINISTPGLLEVFGSVFPRNLFHVFTQGANILLPLLLLSFVLGFHLFFDREIAEPTYNLFDSLSRILFRINSYMIMFSSLLVIPITAFTILQFRNVENLPYYGRLLITTASVTAFLLLILIPGILFLANRKENPYVTLLRYLTTSIAAFFSGDIFFSTLYSIKSSSDNDGVPRRIGSPLLSLYSLFARSGTAVISAVTMLFILRSYSALELTFFQVFWVFIYSFLISLLTFHTPVLSVYLTLATMCGLYGRGLENGYQDLIPVLPFLGSFAVLLDSMTAAILNHLVSRHQKDFVEISLSECS